MTNDLWQMKIPAYVDGELSSDETRAMDLHLRECAVCASDALQQMRLKQSNKLAGSRFTPSAEFRRKIAAQVAAKTAAPIRSSWRWMWSPAFAAALLVIVVVSGVLIRRSFEQSRSQQLLAELTDLHVANLAASNPVEVVSTDRHTVKPWFQGKLPFSFDLPELAGTPFTLLGGRLTYLDHEPGAHLIYNVGAHHLSLFVFRDQPELTEAFAEQQSSRSVLSFHVDAWSSRGLRYFVVGDANPQSIHDLSAMLEKANQ